MLTMLIGGLWHGANWTFVVWGAYHGALLAAYRRFAHWWDPMPPALRQVAMFLAALVGWVFFRSADFSMAWHLLRIMVLPTAGATIPGVGLLVAWMGLAGWWAMRGPNAFDMHASWRFHPGHAFWWAAAMGASLALMAGTGASPFLYFQF